MRIKCLFGKHEWKLDEDTNLSRGCIHCTKRQRKVPPLLQSIIGKSFGHSAWKWKTEKKSD